MCRLLDVTYRNYYYWVSKGCKPWSSFDSKLGEKITSVFNDSDKIYGSVKIRQELIKIGYSPSCKTINKYMLHFNLVRNIKTYKHEKIIKQVNTSTINENLIKNNFTSDIPNSKYFIDNMQVNYKGGSFQLIGLMDAFDRSFKWKLAENVKQENVIPFIKEFINITEFAKYCVIHQDNGSEYKNLLYQELLKRAGLQLSYSKPGESTQNSIIENSFKYIRRECEFKCKNMSKDQAIKELNDYLYKWNTKRTQGYNNYQTPNEKRSNYYIKQIIKQQITNLEIR